MKFSTPLIPAIFIERPNRFLTRVEIDGKIVESHLPDPGRLKELLYPGVELRVQSVPEDSQRKTRFTTTLVKTGDVWVSLISIMANTLAKEWLMLKQIPYYEGYDYDRAEIPFGNHRFDFLLTKDKKPYYLEVKSVTYSNQGIGQFPDAVTARGTRHVNTLAKMNKEGISTGILFVCQRHDIESFKPMWDRDPVFSQALFNAYNDGINVFCVSAKVNEKGINYYKEIPVYLSPPER